MYVRCFIAAVLMCLVVGIDHAMAVVLNEDAPQYVNQRYGFSLTLPSGHWEASESANSDGAVLRSTTWKADVRAYGTMGYSVQGMNFDAAVAKEFSAFAKIGHKEMDKKARRFSIWGTDKEGRDTFLMCYFGKEAANVVIVSVPDGLASMDFEQVTQSVRRSFRPGF
ncbi:MAG: hypothetical protein IJU65_03010 [Desulfovibrio sp.]|nr:hypothetical protein [Desulfovibrio sp.]